jgi:hypothetical protein
MHCPFERLTGFYPFLMRKGINKERSDPGLTVRGKENLISWLARNEHVDGLGFIVPVRGRMDGR